MAEDMDTYQKPMSPEARATPAHKNSGRGNDSIIMHATAPPEKYAPLRPRQVVRAKPVPSPAAGLSLTLCTKGETRPISQGKEVVGPQQPTKWKRCSAAGRCSEAGSAAAKVEEETYVRQPSTAVYFCPSFLALHNLVLHIHRSCSASIDWPY